MFCGIVKIIDNIKIKFSLFFFHQIKQAYWVIINPVIR